jgi:hypothetical protein
MSDIKKEAIISITIEPYLQYASATGTLLASMVFLINATMAAETSPKSELLDSLKAIGNNDEGNYLEVSRTYFSSQATIHLVSQVELYYQNVITAVLKIYPNKIGSTSLRFEEIMSLTTDELIQKAIDIHLNKIMYAKPFDYLLEIANLLSIESTTLKQNWKDYIELKARRDLGIHNNWIVNETYLRKLKEASITSSYSLGDKISPDHDSFIADSKCCDNLVGATKNLLTIKWK